MYMRAFREVRKAFPRPMIIGMGNGVCRWQLMEFLDGAMAEGLPSFLGRAAFLCPERPTMCLSEGEYAFQNALLYGAWVHVSPYFRYPMKEPLPKDAVRLFAAYNPLFEFLKGRKWVYAPDPIQVAYTPPSKYTAPLLHANQQKLRGNVFKMPQGNYVAIVLAAPRGMMYPKRDLEGVTVRVKAPGARSCSAALVFGPDYRGYYIRKPKLCADGYVEVAVPHHGAATMVVLAKDLSKLRKVCRWEKLQEKRLR